MGEDDFKEDQFEDISGEQISRINKDFIEDSHSVETYKDFLEKLQFLERRKTNNERNPKKVFKTKVPKKFSNTIPLFEGRPVRETKICEEDLMNLKIALESSTSLEQLLSLT